MDLLELLRSRGGLSIAAAESLTAGRVQSIISGTPGISEFFRGGVTAYTINAKVELLGVDREEAERVNCVSAHVARQMAQGVTQLFHCDLGIATTGYAEPYLPRNIQAPCAYWAIWDQRSQTTIGDGYYRAAAQGRIEAQKEIAGHIYQALRSALLVMHQIPIKP